MGAVLELQTVGAEYAGSRVTPIGGAVTDTEEVLLQEEAGEALTDSALTHVRAMVREKVDELLPKAFLLVAADFASLEDLQNQWASALAGLFLDRCLKGGAFNIMNLSQDVTQLVQQVILLWRKGQKDQIRSLLGPFQHA